LLLAACAEPAAQPAKAPRRYQANATVLQDRRYGASVVHLTAALTPAA
jgi:hypothetical protein